MTDWITLHRIAGFAHFADDDSANFDFADFDFTDFADFDNSFFSPSFLASPVAVARF